MVIFAKNKEDKMNNAKTRSRRKFTAEFEIVEGTRFSPVLPRLERAFEVTIG